MKQILYKIIFIFALTTLFVSCEKDELTGTLEIYAPNGYRSVYVTIYELDASTPFYSEIHLVENKVKIKLNAGNYTATVTDRNSNAGLSRNFQIHPNKTVRIDLTW